MTATPTFVRALKGMIWVYLILLIFEGALRKWVLPGLSTPLLIVRDPVVIVIYLLAMSSKCFPINAFIIVDIFLAIGATIGGFFSPDSNFMVTIIGLRCYFLHLPLIFVMEKTLDRDDVFRMGKLILWVSLPITVLLVDQFYSPQTAWVNLDVGGNVGLGMSGALGHFRPSATFSFTTGVSEFYPLALAILLGFLVSRKPLSLILTIAAGLSVLIAIPFSISRTNFLTCAIVLVAALLSLMFLPKPPMLVARVLVIVAALAVILPWLGFLSDGMKVFKERWTMSTGEDAEGFKKNIVDRALSDVLLNSDYFFDSDSLMGEGVGFGTNMAQAYLTGKRNFALGESEWPRALLEMGPVLGAIFICLRMALAARMVVFSLLALRRENVLPILICVDGFLLILNAQWGQSTTLGFATFTAGLTFAAVNLPEGAAAPAKPRRPPAQRWSPRSREPWRPLGSRLPGPEAPPPLSGSTP